MGKATLGGSLSEQRFERARQRGITAEGTRLAEANFPADRVARAAGTSAAAPAAPSQNLVPVGVDDLDGRQGQFDPLAGKVTLDRASVAKMTREDRAALVRHELAHAADAELDQWRQVDTALWDLWEQDPKHPIFDYMRSHAGAVSLPGGRFKNGASDEILASLYADDYRGGTFTLKADERPFPYEWEGEAPVSREYRIPPVLFDALEAIEGKLGIWAKRDARRGAASAAARPRIDMPPAEEALPLARERVQQRAGRRIDRGVARVANQINPDSVSAREFGEGLPKALEANIARSKGVQRQAYQEFEDAVESNAETVTNWATPEQIAGAKPAQKRAARDLQEQMNSQNVGRKVLQFIAGQGGIRDVGDDLTGEAKALAESAVSAAKGATRNKRVIGGVEGVYNRQNGISPAEMLERIKNNPEIAGPLGIDPNTLDDLPDSALFDIIDDAVYKAQRFRPVSFEQALGQVLTKTDVVGTPVSLAELKALAKPIYDDAADSLTPDERSKSVALNAMRQLIEGPDVVGAVRADKHLSAMKRILREEGGAFPNIRTRDQALAQKMIAQLEGDLAASAERAGPGAMDALKRGREATKAMYATAEVLDQFKTEPVATFDKLARDRDKSIALLRQVAAEAPSELPKLGRAIVDEIHATRSYGKWATYGRESKRLILGSDKMVDVVDRSMARWANLEAIARGRDGKKSAAAMLHDLTRNKDEKLPQLQALAKRMPHLGRAWLEDLFVRVSKNAEVKGQVSLFNEYDRLGDGVKRTLLRPDVRDAMDDLSLYVRKTSEDRNPPGTAYMGALAGQAGTLMTGVVGMVAGVPGAGLAIASVVGVNAAALVFSEIMHSPRALLLLRNVLEAERVGGAQSAAAVAAFQNYLKPYTQREGPSQTER
jgi:hypothetical protein